MDAFFQKFRDAGLRVGVCVRAQEIRFVEGVPQQSDSPDAAATLKSKIAYARKRWGCTLFYVDSTVKGDNNALDADVFREVASAFPDVLLMPENETLRYFAYSAPLNSFQHHKVTSTPPGARQVYPGAFSVLLAGEGDVQKYRSDLVAGPPGGHSALSWLVAEPQQPHYQKHLRRGALALKGRQICQRNITIARTWSGPAQRRER